MPITFTLHSIQTVETPVPDSDLTDITVNRDGFRRSNYNASTIKQDGDLNWAPVNEYNSLKSYLTFWMFFLVAAAVGYQRHEAQHVSPHNKKASLPFPSVPALLPCRACIQDKHKAAP